jgi:hypothetical protein
MKGKKCFNKVTERKRFKNLTEEKIKEAYNFQHTGNHYTFYQEKETAESIFNDRFNFLLIIYGLFVNAFFVAATKHDKLILLFTGGIVILLLSFTIWRTFQKLDILLKILYSLGEYHTFDILDIELRSRSKFIEKCGKITTLAIVIPLLLTLSFAAAIVAIHFDFWKYG